MRFVAVGDESKDVLTHVRAQSYRFPFIDFHSCAGQHLLASTTRTKQMYAPGQVVQSMRIQEPVSVYVRVWVVDLDAVPVIAQTLRQHGVSGLGGEFLLAETALLRIVALRDGLAPLPLDAMGPRELFPGEEAGVVFVELCEDLGGTSAAQKLLQADLAIVPSVVPTCV